MFTQVIQVLVGAVLFGCIYALVGSGLNLVWGVCNILNAAHGQFLVLGAYITWIMTAKAGLNPLLSLPVSAVILFIVGALTQYGLMEWLATSSVMVSFLLLFGLGLALESLTLWAFGATARSVTLYQGAITVGQISISYDLLAITIISVAVFVAMHIYLRYSKLGVATAATGQNYQIAQACGINVKMIRILTMGLASAMAGLAGSCLVFAEPIDPNSGFNYVTIAFVVLILGGLGSFYGAIVAGVLVAAATGLVELWTNGNIATSVEYLILPVVLLIRPTGLFGGAQRSMT